MFQNRDTIAAQATAAGEGGVAIVRVSGADCRRIISRVFRAKNGKPLENRVLTYGYVMEDGGVADEAMAVLMRAPRTVARTSPQTSISPSSARAISSALLVSPSGIPANQP